MDRDLHIGHILLKTEAGVQGLTGRNGNGDLKLTGKGKVRFSHHLKIRSGKLLIPVKNLPIPSPSAVGMNSRPSGFLTVMWAATVSCRVQMILIKEIH